VYVDGFNLYYWLKPLPYRWIDLKRLVLDAITDSDNQPDLVALKYFTAPVSDTADDPRKSTRQSVYINALSAVIPELRIYYGEFRRQKQWKYCVGNGDSIGRRVQVWDTEEKGSDVNLAVQLVNDAWSNAFDVAIVVSNDSDLVSAVKIARKKGKKIGVLVRGDAGVYSLKRFCSFQKVLTESGLRAALMPREIPGKSLRIPTEWAKKEDAAGIR
jgi:NYN domain